MMNTNVSNPAPYHICRSAAEKSANSDSVGKAFIVSSKSNVFPVHSLTVFTPSAPKAATLPKNKAMRTTAAPISTVRVKKFFSIPVPFCFLF
ncbi:MAG TPA: hypothetical protein DD624_02115 [Alphaproteobacteria bacterium]|nr:hypothetical protein [Alphaproteobacteria bacterium]